MNNLRHPEKINKQSNPIPKKPPWIRVKAPNSKVFNSTSTILKKKLSGNDKHTTNTAEVTNENDKTSEKIMKKSNPLVLPRNHLVEDALKTAETGDLEKTNRLLKVLSEPYKIQSSIQDLQPSPKPSKIPYKTFCGT